MNIGEAERAWRRGEPLDLHVCTDCDVRHYDNCPVCFGFGVTSAGGPVSAGRAETIETKACPACGSDHRGVAA